MIEGDTARDDPDDLGSGSVSDDQQEQYKKQLEHEQWRRRFERRLSNGAAVLATICIIVLIIYSLGYEHDLADAPAIVALATIPTVLFLALMRAHLTSYKLKEDDRSGLEQFPATGDGIASQTVSRLATELVRAVGGAYK